MIYCFGELKSKEIVDVKTGEKLGFVDDLEFDGQTHSIISLIAYGRPRFFGFFGHQEDIVIPCESIRLIGTDTILVSLENGEKPTKHHKFTLESLYK
ncbi:MAG: YlmC/YmxH family sporulation protein [Oscillospiraceae bacterium]|nr:YlmC/YmxH family sporulation protein [Oscillospiraceae bacterium]